MAILDPIHISEIHFPLLENAIFIQLVPCYDQEDTLKLVEKTPQAYILWWALSSGPAVCLPASFAEPAAGWLSDIMLVTKLIASAIETLNSKEPKELALACRTRRS
ncbi:hypothetical protein DSO57_1010049 [Entomophthora muscae]|uniref:Uncharacterized protein n=1 Tax=Entomophthora muscae TaxID=34485 RepID=A0ACC2TUC0_9FUNG|nr:hypothetical protein DSO57_1010049 [Entomophthora muscae]